MYDNRPIYITLYCTYGEWSICLSVKSGSTKHLIKLAGVLGVNITGNGASLNLEVTEKDLLSKVKQIRSYRERFAFQGEANPVTLRLLRKMNLS